MLVVMLLWLVAPAEATVGGSTVLGGVPVAAAAARVGATVNYRAAMEDETTWDLQVLSKGKGVMRLMSISSGVSVKA